MSTARVSPRFHAAARDSAERRPCRQRALRDCSKPVAVFGPVRWRRRASGTALRPLPAPCKAGRSGIAHRNGARHSQRPAQSATARRRARAHRVHCAESWSLPAKAPPVAERGSDQWRPLAVFRTLFIYTEARTIADILDGPSHHDLIGVRSAVEHLHENQYLESFDRKIRLDLLRKEAITEHIARSALARIVGDSNLWPHFANTSSLREFWALEETKRRQIWGDPINPMDAIADSDPKYIPDGLLGAR
jgi:hypothetical protein